MRTDISEPKTAPPILSWVLVLLVLALLSFIVLGPLFHSPEIDHVIDYWRVNYFAKATWLTVVFVGFLRLRAAWRRFRDEGEWLELGWVLRLGLGIASMTGVLALIAWRYFLGET